MSELQMAQVVRVSGTEGPLGKIFLRFSDGCVGVRWPDEFVIEGRSFAAPVRTVYKPHELEPLKLIGQKKALE